MKIGDFFTTAPYAEPVNPEHVTFTAVARCAAGIMPGGARNPLGSKPIRTKVTAGLVFLGGEEVLEARLAAREHLDKLCTDDQGNRTRAYDSDDLNHEYAYQMLVRFLREWDVAANDLVAGAPALFPEIDQLRDLVVPAEALRVFKAYNEYVKREHPEVPAKGTFPETDGAGEGVAPAASRRSGPPARVAAGAHRR